MKKAYTTPEVEIENFNLTIYTADVIWSSNGDGDEHVGGDGDDGFDF